MTDPIDDEWEYEYDEVETEDFYIPIDLSNVPKGQKLVDSERRTGHPTLLKSRLRALNAQRGQQQQDASTGEASSEQEPATLGEAQIIGLHTPNPLVMYNGQLLSCQWASTIGTDMFFAKPSADASSEEKPLRSLPNVDLLAISSAKLVAKVGRLRPRDDLFDGVGEEDGVAAAAAPTEVNNGEAQDSAQVSEPAPTSFLARINQVKAKRGDSTRLAVSQSGNGLRLVSKAASDAAQDTTGQGTEDVEMGGT
ncbi:uncharacterized protein EKO05_0001058 [Ascochyta rabiei]|uniref:Uncharacterized protein n=1 Tax=Didymella rabiei TaxID=5454 RepID=A0A163EP46_DIDRA|nr:uncharacterized protein EKO05_0001058 [Ascochyta rabiei]KZM23815.1 hypothetical protein ST47_g5007 [Ascochyta rabiei]UPX10396.1 hypothetical protein EKO05_0001058 [Ascochyta rabiei]